MGKTRIPLAINFESRDGTIGGRDGYIQNGYVDEDASGAKFVYRRPGTNVFYNPAAGNYAQGQFYFNGFEYLIVNDVLIRTTGSTLSGSSGQSAVNVPPQWAGRFKHVMLAFNDRMWVICGQLNSGAIGNDVWSTQDGVTWALQTSTAGTGSRVGLGACVFNNAMWIMGGFQGSTVYSDVWSSTDGTVWTQATAAAPWVGRYDFGCVAANNGIYIMGGSNLAGATLNDVWFSSDGINWAQVTSAVPFTTRSGATCLVFQNKFWMIGGASSPGVYRNDVWSSPDGMTWTQVNAAAFATARGFMAGCVYNNKMWLFGGVQTGGVELSTVLSSSDGITWTQVSVNPGFSSGRQAAAAVVFKTPATINQFRYETMWVSGGYQAFAFVGKQENYRFNLDTSTSTFYPLSPTIAGQFYQFATFENGTQLLFKNQCNFYVLRAGTLIKVTDPNYPPATVPGLVVLNDFAYVMTPEAEIHACKIFDALTWPSLQFITASFEDDKGTGLAKYLNYIVAFGTYTIQYFYDAGNPPPGVSISPYINANQKVGMVGQNAAGLDGHPTFANSGNTIFFLGQTQQGAQGIYMINGMQPQKISTPQVDRALIGDSAPSFPELIWATSADTGHNFIVINLNQGTVALVYDLQMKMWYVWASQNPGYNGSFFYYGNISVDEASGQTLWVGGQNVQIYNVSAQNLFTDAGVLIDMIMQTAKIDGGTMQKKFFGIVDLVCAQAFVNSNMVLNWTDDDYQNYSAPVFLNIGVPRPRANRLGAARRRAFKLECQDVFNRVQFEALELTVSPGES
jgi:hypothetical protein